MKLFPRSLLMPNWVITTIMILIVVVVVVVVVVKEPREVRDGGPPPPAELGPERAAQPQPTTRPGDEARALIAEFRKQGATDLASVFGAANEFLAERQLTDAHLLYFYAAREGHAPSARALAEMYDPLRHSAKTSIMDEPDPSQAYKWYRRAADTGDAVARQRLSELRVWVEQAAAKGNSEAIQLLMGWK